MTDNTNPTNTPREHSHPLPNTTSNTTSDDSLNSNESPTNSVTTTPDELTLTVAYQCKVCADRHSTFDGIEQHILMAHTPAECLHETNAIIKCNYCLRSKTEFTVWSEFTSHLTQHHPDRHRRRIEADPGIEEDDLVVEVTDTEELPTYIGATDSETEHEIAQQHMFFAEIECSEKIERTFDSDELLEVLYVINKHAKQFDDRASTHTDPDSTAAAAKRDALYEIKSRILNQLTDQCTDISIHQFNGHDHYYFDFGDYGFHAPFGTGVSVPRENVTSHETIHDFTPDSTVDPDLAEMSLNQALGFCYAECNINANRYLAEGSFLKLPDPDPQAGSINVPELSSQNK